MVGRNDPAEERAKFLEEYAKKASRPSLDRYEVRVRRVGRGLTATRISIKLKTRDETGEGQSESGSPAP